MMPTDLAARLRLLSEATVNPVSAVRGISAELPELPLGQRFTARIESALPDSTFRAVVAERSLTLSLPQSAKPGDTLELIVTARTPHLIVAESAKETAARQPPPATLSHAGRIISTLLANEEQVPQPAMLSRSTPLLAEPPLQAGRLVSALQQVVVESGLFYESHQAQWVAGRYPAEALAREPQARLLRPLHAPDAASASKSAPTEDTAETSSPRSAEPAAGRSTTATTPSLPAELQLLVQQQLDVAATQHIIWRGEVWPGQTLQWEIAADEQRQDAPEEETAKQWTTSLALTLPRLGEVNVVLRITPAKVSLGMTASESAAALKQGLTELAAAFAAAGLPPLAASVQSHEPT